MSLPRLAVYPTGHGCLAKALIVLVYQFRGFLAKPCSALNGMTNNKKYQFLCQENKKNIEN
jgi:hypothetical protein